MKKLWILALTITLVSIFSIGMSQESGTLSIKAGASTVITPGSLFFRMATIAPGTGTLYELRAQTSSQFPMEPQFHLYTLSITDNCLALRDPGDPAGYVPIPVDYTTLDANRDSSIKISWQDIGPDGIYDTSDDVWPTPPSLTEGGFNSYYCLGTEGYPCYTPICVINCASDSAKMHARIEADETAVEGRRALVFILHDAKTNTDLDAYCMELIIEKPGAQLIITWLSVILVPLSIFGALGALWRLKVF